jgi:hypothetical protein
MNSTRFTRIAPSYVAEEKSVFTTLLPIIHDHGALSKRLSGIGKNRPKNRALSLRVNLKYLFLDKAIKEQYTIFISLREQSTGDGIIYSHC